MTAPWHERNMKIWMAFSHAAAYSKKPRQKQMSINHLGFTNTPSVILGWGSKTRKYTLTYIYLSPKFWLVTASESGKHCPTQSPTGTRRHTQYGNRSKPEAWLRLGRDYHVMMRHISIYYIITYYITIYVNNITCVRFMRLFVYDSSWMGASMLSSIVTYSYKTTPNATEIMPWCVLSTTVS